ncbi:MAG: hypothetical protein QOJ48_964 [Frankiales bacterium]|nr:hypothetical protein [Frankiales bacterium]
MRKTTKTIVTLASCGAAFALPLAAAGVASATPSPNGTLTISSNNDNGVTKAMGTATKATGTVTGSAYGTASGPSVTKVVSKFKPGTPYSNSYNGGYYSQSSSGVTSSGTVLSLTKTGNSVIVAKYNATSDCGSGTTTYNWWLEGNFVENFQNCSVNGTGKYFATGGAVANGLPNAGNASLYSSSSSYSYGANGSVWGSGNSSYHCQTFNAQYSCDN